MLPARGQFTELQCGKQAVALKVGVVARTSSIVIPEASNSSSD